MHFLYQRLPWKAFVIASGVLSFLLYFVMIYRPFILQPDLDEHIEISNKMWASMRLPAHPIFYLLVQLLSGFSRNLTLQVMAALFVFSGAQWAKIVVSAKIVKEVFGYEINALLAVSLLCFQLVSNFSPWQDTFIKDQLSINYFHNGTLLVTMPFSLMLFMHALRYFKHDRIKDLNNMILWGLLAALAKPSFIFCIVAAFPLYVMLIRGISISFFRAVALSAILTSFILMQSIYLKFFPPAYIEQIVISLKPFYLFGSIQHHFWVLINTLGLALVGLWVFHKERKALPEMRFVFAMLITAYFIAFNFVDEINGTLFTNMTWQVPIVLNILYILLIGLFAQPGTGIAVWRRWVFAGCFLLYFMYGLYYLYMVQVFHTFFI